ncbi:plasmid mobilization protein [Actinomyces naeslundii]|uniref:plasmid mobilization protein n=1 Tax=Actinomyces naeslundii TaxID=1655 RepID=UPI003D2F5500
MPVEAVRSSVSLPPTASVASEDGSQRGLGNEGGARLFDKSPAGLSSEPAQKEDHRAGSVSTTRRHREALRVVEDRETLDARIAVRVSLSELDAVRRRARGLGVKPSAWARAVLRDALDTRRHEVRDLAAHAVAPRPAPEVSEAVEQLRRVGVNLNQVLRRGDVVDADLLCELRDAVSTLRGSLGDRTVV